MIRYKQYLYDIRCFLPSFLPDYVEGKRKDNSFGSLCLFVYYIVAIKLINGLSLYKIYKKLFAVGL